MERIGFTLRSGNNKTGGIPVSTSSRETCPLACALRGKGGCYAQYGPIAIFWNRVSEGRAGYTWGEFLGKVRGLPPGTLWRHSQAGDLPGKGDYLAVKRLGELVEANCGRLGYTYTHKPLRRRMEREAVKEAVLCGFTINLSADCLGEADRLADLGIAPVVSLIPLGSPKRLVTPGGRQVRLCMHQVNGVRCTDCRICSGDRDFIVGFLLHGTRVKAADRIARGEEWEAS